MQNFPKTLFLPRFLPYRLTKLSGIVSRSLAGLYSKRFKLSIQEWRVIAILGSEEGLTSGEIGELSALSKVNVSRAADRLEKSGCIERRILDADRRSAALFLTLHGRKTLAEIAPLAQNYEDRLLEDFTPAEIEQLDSFLNRLDSKAEELKDALEELQ